MILRISTPPRFALPMAAIVLATSWLNVSHAVDYTWKAGTGTWSSTGSWLGGSIPVSATGNAVFFNAPGANADQIVYLNGNQAQSGSISILNTGSTTFMSGTAATVTGTNTLTVQNLFVNAGSGPVTFGGPGSIVLNIINSAGATNGYVNNASSTLTFNGTLDAAGTARPIVYGGSGVIDQIGALIGGRDFAKFGTGTVSLRAASTLTTAANQAVVAGGVRLVDAGTLPSVTTVGFGIRAGGELILDNRGTANVGDRIANTALIASAFGGGGFEFFGANNATSTETTGTLSVGSGAFLVSSTPGASGTNTLTFSTLSRTTGATLVFDGTGLGSASNAVVFTTAPTLASNIIGGYATIGNEFATYNQDGAGNANANGVQAVGNSAYSSTFGAGNNVKLTTGGAFGNVANTVNLQTAAGQAFTIATSSTLSAVLNYAASGVNTISGGTMTNGTGELIFITNSDLSVGSKVTGNGALTKSGPGTLTLSSGGATRTGPNVSVNAGTLKITDATAVYNTGATVTGTIVVGQRSTFEVGTTTAWTTASRMPTLRLNDVDATLKVSGSSTMSFDKAIGISSMFLSGNTGASQAAEPVRVFLNAETASDTLDLSQAVQIVTGNSGAATITLNGAGTVILSGTASNNTAASSALNGFYGWNVTGGGKLLVTSSGANPLGLTGGTVTATQGVVALGSDNTTNYAYVLGGGTLAAAGGGTRTINAASTVAIRAASTIDLKNAGVGATDNMGIAFGGILSGSGGLTIVATGTGQGILTLSGSSTFTGPTTVQGGRLRIDPTGVFNSTSGVTVNGAAAEFAYNSATTLSRPLTLTQGVLSGTGTIGTAVSVGSGATLSPGNSPGTQPFTSGQTWLSGGTYDWEINDATGTLGGNPGWDLLDVTGGTLNLASLTSSAQFTLDLITLNNVVSGSMANYVPGQSYTWQIVRTAAGGVVTSSGVAAGGTDLTGLFNIVTTNWASGPAPSSVQVMVSSGGTGLDLVIVPEPQTLAMAGIGAVVAGWSLWKRRRVAVTRHLDRRP